MRRRWHPIVLGAASLLAAGLLGSGCASGRNTLGTGSSPCFQELPTSTAAVHDRGHFLGVRLVTEAQLRTFQHLAAALAAHSVTPVNDVCLVAFSGSFLSTQVEQPLGELRTTNPDPYAVVVVSSPQNHLLATFVLPMPPLQFRHSFIGH